MQTGWPPSGGFPKLGKDRVIWRFDPLLLTDSMRVDDLLAKVERIGRKLHRYTEKFVFSFADIAGYPKVQKNLEASGVRFREFDVPAMQAFAAGLSRHAGRLENRGRTCAETIDLSPYGIGHNRCIDGELLLKISRHDPELLHVFGIASDTAGPPVPRRPGPEPSEGQGPAQACGCVASKDIGQYNTCPHLCRYCYANASAKLVASNMGQVSADGESILADRTIGEMEPRQGASGRG